MSTVFLAKNLSIDVLVAIKLLRPHGDGTSMARCLREAKALASIPSKYVVRAHDVRTMRDGRIYLIMEYLDGEDLSVLLQREGQLPWSRAANMMRMVCAGLAASHRCNLIHRDVKLANCFRTTRDEDPDHITLIDFGIAKDTASGVDLTQQGCILGTPAYMAPELVRGGAPDARSDLYAVGVMLFKLLTGSLPFNSKSVAEIQRCHLAVAPQAPSAQAPGRGIPPEADEIVLRALAKPPEQRFQTAKEMALAIEAALARGAAGPVASVLEPSNLAMPPAPRSIA